MPAKFQSIGLVGRYHGNKTINDTIVALEKLLLARNLDVFIDTDTANTLTKFKSQSVDKEHISQQCDLVIAVGGDGSFISAAKVVMGTDTPILGINRGRLGFLTDIGPHELDEKISDILAGNYLEEDRFFLEADIADDKRSYFQGQALNDVVLSQGDKPHLIEFEIYVDDQFVCNQRADGLITATPTGSTAYSLSGGGPILHPKLNAIVLSPMFPHTLSSRPIVVSADSEIRLVISEHNIAAPKISCDSQERISVHSGQSVRIRKKKDRLKLIHPVDYQYFDTLRSKLHWEIKH